MQSPYTQLVSESFRSTSPEIFGNGQTTGSEYRALGDLHRSLGRNREATLDAIIQDGYPLPSVISPEDIAFTGAAHACGVTEHLADARGVEGRDSTYESYTVKNRFDRFVSRHLPTELREEWEAPVNREEGFTNESISYPVGVDETKIHGGALPHRFLPAQTMRYLEFARLGKLDATTKDEWQINDSTNLGSFAVEWNILIPGIETATSLLGLMDNIANGIAVQLHKNGLTDQQITAVINKGFSLEGMIQEHGNFDGLVNISEAIHLN